MESNKYLPTGSIVGGHYEIVDVLGEDAFDILYLVRDNHRRGSFFVLKELFLETFSSRNKESVYTIPQAQGVFDKRKEEIIREVENSKRTRQIADIKTYGYIEDNSTIYTIMEFTNNSDLTHYLQFQPKDEIILPPLEDLIDNPPKKKKSSIFLKILIVAVIIGVALALYANKMIQEDRAKAEEKPKVEVKQTPIHHPPLVSRDDDNNPKEQDTPKKIVEEKEPKIEEAKETTTDREYIPTTETTTPKENEEPQTTQTDTVNEDTIYIDNEEEIIDEEEIVETKPTPVVIKREEPKNIPLGTKIESTHTAVDDKTSTLLGTKIEQKHVESFNRASIQHFLNGFIASSANGSVEDIASKYDYHVDRYFSLRNVTQSTIKKDKRRYNRRWTHREFTIKNFKILKTYQRDNTDYCDLKTTTRWRVSTNSGKTASGSSQGFMTIKKTDHGFKVKSIYTLK